MRNEPFEALYLTTTGYYLYVQYTADDPEYDFDYTIYDRDFLDEDGGVIGEYTKWDLDEAADQILRAGPVRYGSRMERLHIDDYRDYLDALTVYEFQLLNKGIKVSSYDE